MNESHGTPGGHDAGLWIRPYTVTGGRTRPTSTLDMLSLVRTTGRVSPERLGVDHSRALRLCDLPTSVAEVAARLQQPVMVTKVLLSDLIESGAATTRAPSVSANSTDLPTLEKVLHALRARC